MQGKTGLPGAPGVPGLPGTRGSSGPSGPDVSIWTKLKTVLSSRMNEYLRGQVVFYSIKETP